MLSLPDEGTRRSVGSHNSDLLLICDWAEACVLFDQKEISTTDVVDMLVEDAIYESQDYAREFVADVWNELRRRASLFESPTNLRVDGERLVCDDDWTADPAYGFCLTLSLAKGFPQWAAAYGADYTEQGALFEMLTVEALESLMPQWKVYKTGWSAAAKNKLAAVVEEVVKRLYEVRGAEIDQWLATSANEAGLDVILYRDFKDLSAGFPLFMLQCASGRDWEEKLESPNLGTWRNIVSFASKPIKAFSMPYCITATELRQTAMKVQGPLFDRYRIFGARMGGASWPSANLEEELLAWTWPRVSALPVAS
jgi:hypothetical protein